VVLLMGSAWDRPWLAAGVLGVIALALAATFTTLRLADQVMHLLGVTGRNVVGRVLGILLTALAVQFVLDGIHATGLLPR
jgi:multiple antibiotic resistance protein